MDMDKISGTLFGLIGFTVVALAICLFSMTMPSDSSSNSDIIGICGFGHKEELSDVVVTIEDKWEFSDGYYFIGTNDNIYKIEEDGISVLPAIVRYQRLQVGNKYIIRTYKESGKTYCIEEKSLKLKTDEIEE